MRRRWQLLGAIDGRVLVEADLGYHPAANLAAAVQAGGMTQKRNPAAGRVS